MGAGNDALGRGRSQGKGSQAGHVKGAESWPGGAASLEGDSIRAQFMGGYEGS